MNGRLSLFLIFAITILITGYSFAQPWQPHVRRMDWWRNTATLDMDFVHDRYMVSLTTPVVYTSLSQFITAVSGTFIRAGVNTTATGDPFYLSANQSFVSRASSATYIDSSGVMRTAAANTARPDYDPVTHAYKGILIEEARTNLVTPASNWSAWSTYNTSIVSGDIAPDGISNFGVCRPSTANVLHYCSVGYASALVTNTVYTLSFYAKSHGSQNAVIPDIIGSGGVNGSRYNPKFDLSNGTIGTGSSIVSSNPTPTTSMVAMGNGVYRCIATWTTSNTALNLIALYTGLYGAYTGDGTSGIQLWGVQVEKGTSPTSYIPTSGTAVTRAADVYTAPYSGTYFDASGTLRNAPANTPRLDYDPSTSEPKGILVEEARTNVAPSDITASPWLSYSPGGTISLISNSDIAPDGTLTAHRITCGGVSQCTRYMGPAVTSGTTYTFSFFTKSAPGGVTCARGRSGSATGGGVTYFSSNVGNGWTRHGFYETVTSSGTWLPSIINYYVNAPCIVWGPQIETGAFPSSYIPTSASSVTRAAEVFSVPTGAWYNPVEGTALVVADHSSTISQTAAALVLYDVNNVNCHRVALSEDSLGRHSYRMMVSDDCSVWDGRDADVIGSGLFSMGAAIKDGDSAIGAHGTVFEATSVPMPPNLNTMSIGSSGGYASFWNRPIRRVTYFPTRQPDYSLPDYTR